MVKNLFRALFALLLASTPACESVLNIPVGLRGSDRYTCENQTCVCTCGYVKCASDEETCDSRCDSRSFIPPPDNPASFGSTPALEVVENVVYVAFPGAQGATNGIVCHRGAQGDSADPVQCVPCEYAIGEASIAKMGGELYVAGRRGACVFDLPSFSRKPDLLPGTGRDINGMTLDVARGELVWVEQMAKPGQSVVLFRKNSAGDTKSVTLAAHNRPSLLVADNGLVAWKVIHDIATDCDTLYLGVDNSKSDTCLVIIDDKNADPTAVEQRSFPSEETIAALSIFAGELYYAARYQPIGGSLRRAIGPDPALDSTLASSASSISEFAILPESPGRIQLIYGTFGGVVYGGPVDLAAPSGAEVLALAGFGDTTQITALSAIRDPQQTGTIAFLNGRQKSADGVTLVPELRRLAIAPFSCLAQP